MEKISFKERVRVSAIEYSRVYKNTLMDYEYLVCSKVFNRGYHIIKSDGGNYLHLVGVHTELKPDIFFDKCYNNELEVNDFDFIKKNQTEKQVKGSVRKKVKALSCEGTEKVPSYEKKYYKSYFLSIYNAFFGIIKVSITGGGTYDRATAKNDFKLLYRYLRVSSP